MHDLTKGNIYKTFILFAIPMVLSGLLSKGYNVIDTIIAGKYIGDNGLAAVGATSALIQLISAIFWGYGVGFAIYIAKLFGEQNFQTLKNSVFTNGIIVSIACVALSAVLIIFKEYIFDFLNVDYSIRKDAYIYYVTYCAGLVFCIFSSNSIFIMNALGISSYPFYMSVISTIVHIIGNILFVTVFKMGVFGLALCTVLSYLIISVCYYFKIEQYFRQMNCQKSKLEMKVFKETYIYSIPTTIQQMIMYIASLMLSPIINSIGSNATAAYTVVSSIYEINASIYQNSSKTLSNYIAQCIGAKKFNRISKGIKVGFFQGIVFLVVPLLVFVIFSEEICLLFFSDNYSGEIFDLANMFVKIYLPFILLNMINNLFHALCRGLKAMNELMAATFIGALARVIASVILAAPYGMKGIYIGWVISWFCEAVFILCVYVKNKLDFANLYRG